VRVLLIAALVAALPSTAAARWTKLTSANFVFIGDASGVQIRRVAERLETFREVMIRALPGATATSPVPTIVVVFATDRSLNPVKPLFRGNTTDVSGYMQSGEDVNYIAINGEYIDIALRTVLHEYAHLLTGNTIGRAPVWVSEGLAEFYATMEGLEGGKSVIIGRAPAEHVDLLKSSTLIPIKELLAIDQGSQVYNEGLRRGVLYAQSWALTHYLTLGNKERASQFRKFLASLRSGLDQERAFSESFGDDIAALDRELFDYVRQFAFPALRMQFSERVVGEADRATTIDDLEGDIHVADLQARIGRDKEARTRLQAIVQKKPDAAMAWTVLGLIDFRERRFTEALPQLERAAERGPQNAFVQTAFGRALVTLINEQTGAEEQATLRKARTTLSRAVELDPVSGYAAGMLGYVELAIGEDLARAVSMLERAVKLAPSRDQYRLFLAQALMRRGDFQGATNQLGSVLATGSSPEARDDARRLLGDVANARVRAESPGAAPATTTGSTGRPIGSVPGLSAPATRATVRLDLRVVQNGETRTLGQFTAIECRPNLIVLQVDASGGTLRLAAKQLSEIDFITYRTDTAGSVQCGALPKPVRVLVTYRVRSETTAAGTIDGDAVAIELVPDDYTPLPSR
jgi:tetratricopeptide (TPR) repeat protein